MHQQQAYNLYCQQLCKFYWQMVYCQIYQIAVSAVSPCDYKKALPKEQNRLTRLDYPDGNFISYEYDLNGNRTLLTTANQVVAYTYDALNRSSTVTDSNGITTYTYDNVGNRATQANANGTKATYSYDNLNRLLDLTHRDASNNVIASYAYTLGANGNRTRIEEATGRVVDYTYDDLYRLITETITDPVNGNHQSEFAYDAVGNRLQQLKDGITTTYIYNSNDQIQSETENGVVTTYTYDNNGNTLTKTIGGTLDTSYSYNKDNRMVQAITSTSTIINTYDAGGIRQAQTVDGITTNYLVDQNRAYAQVIEEQDSANNPQITYVYGDDLISQTQSGATHTFGYDGLGSTRILTGSTGAVQNSYGYQAFGEVDYQLGTVANNYLFTGEQYDENVDSYYLRSRYYNTKIGRFNRMDDFEGIFDQPLSLNKYLYVHSNPVNLTDPSGQSILLLYNRTFSLNYAGVQTATRVLFKVVVTVAIALPLHSLSQDIINTIFLAENSNSDSSSGDAVQRQAEYDAIKSKCDRSPFGPRQDCSALSKKLTRTKWCVRKFQDWDDKWLKGRHDDKISYWLKRIKNLIEAYNRKCTNKL